MSALSGLVRKELRRYSAALDKALCSFETRPELQSADEFAGILAEVHALFEDDFLDRLEPSGWIAPLFEHSLVPLATQLISFILHAHQQAREFGLLFPTGTSAKLQFSRPDSDVAEQPRPSVLTQLAAVEVSQASFPIQWAAQAIQMEASSHQPLSQRLGPRLLEQLTSDQALRAMAGSARLIQNDLWAAPGPAAPTPINEDAAEQPANGNADDAAAAAEVELEDADVTAINFNGAVAIIRATLRRGKSVGSGVSVSASGGASLFRRGANPTEHSLSGASSAGSTALIGVRLLSVVANYISTALAAVQDQSPPPHVSSRPAEPVATGDGLSEADADGAAAPAEPSVPAIQRFLEDMNSSGVLSALCGAVLAAPPCLLATSDADGATVDDYSQLLSEIQLTLFMILWDLSALLAAPYGKIAAELLAAAEVVQLRREALLQVAASGLTAITETPARSGEIQPITDAADSDADGGETRVDADGDASSVVPHSPAAAAVCWPLLRCQAVQRICAVKGLQFSDVVHIMIDAAVGAIVVPQDLGGDGAAAAALAVQSLFPSPLAAAELAVRVCRALHQHLERLALQQAKAARVGQPAAGRGYPHSSPDAFGARSLGMAPGGRSGNQHKHVTQQQYTQQREQLADDAASVEAAIRVCVAGASPADAAACHPAVAAVRKLVVQLAAAAAVPPPQLLATAEAAEPEQQVQTHGFVAMTLADGDEVTPRVGSTTGRRGGSAAKSIATRRTASPPALSPVGASSPSGHPPASAAASTSASPVRAGGPKAARPLPRYPVTTAAAVAGGSTGNSATSSARDHDIVLAGSPRLSVQASSTDSGAPMPTLRDPMPCIVAASPPPPSPDRSEEPADKPAEARPDEDGDGGKVGVAEAAGAAAGEAAPDKSPVAGQRRQGGKRRLRLLPRGLRNSFDKLKRWVAARSP